ncbi:MAG: AAA family ATPase [Bryobacterales bacterium]|nr:AAA family ATPase [Bryobacterales bacterium]
MTTGRATLLDPQRTGREAERLEASLRRLIVGQEEAIQHIVNIYQMYLTGMAPPGRPVGVLLFLGPTGSGKTRIVEATAEILLGSPRAVVKIDCAEFQHSHEIAKLIGSPPGYLGHRETHPLLSQEVLNQYHTEKLKLSFVLFDEIEKASDALWNLLLGILDKATLTLGDNRRVDFSRALIFMTSNLGAAEMNALIEPKLGFRPPSNAANDRRLAGRVSQAGLEAARRKFTPEFINRLDKIVVFRPLGESELRQVLDIELRLLQRRIFLSSAQPFLFTLSPAAKDYLLEEGVDLRYGARHLKRAIERLLVQPLSNLIATEQIAGGDLIRVDFDPASRSLIFFKEGEGISVVEMAARADLPLPLCAAAQVELAAETSRTGSARTSRRG